MLRLAGISLTAALVLAPACSKRSSDTPAAPAEDVAQAQSPEASEQAEGADDSDWRPAEHKSGAAKWKDPAVYIDGKPIGVLEFSELPRSLEPTWVEVEDFEDFLPGEERKMSVDKERRYRIDRYLTAVGVDVARVKQVHLYGGKAWVAAIDGDEFRRTRKDLQFAFSRETEGKVKIYFPRGVKTNTSFDRIAGIAVYVDREVPHVDPEEDRVVVDGKPIEEVPYFGEPLRGGVRVYVDDRLAIWIKRNQLEDAPGRLPAGEDGKPSSRWSLPELLSSEGVAVDELVAGEIIYHGERSGRLDREFLASATFTTSPRSGGEVLVGDDGTPANALMLYTKPLPVETARNGDGVN